MRFSFRGIWESERSADSAKEGEKMFAQLISTIDSFLWGWPLIILLFGTHIFMTIRTGFIQKDIFKAIKMSVTADEDSEGDVSQFGALTTALSSTIGTGNIIGVGTAIAMGGPGSVFWMWMTGIFGIATKYAETLIGVKYRVKSENGTMIGGAMYALDRGLNAKWAGILFSSLAALCAFGIGCTVQANAVVANITTNFSVSPIIVAVILSAIVALVIIGGIQSITKVSERLVPFMAAFYVLGCLVILVKNADVLGQAIGVIISSAFTTKAVGGGFVHLHRKLRAAALWDPRLRLPAASVWQEASSPMNPVWVPLRLSHQRHRLRIRRNRRWFP